MAGFQFASNHIELPPSEVVEEGSMRIESNPLVGAASLSVGSQEPIFRRSKCEHELTHVIVFFPFCTLHFVRLLAILFLPFRSERF